MANVNLYTQTHPDGTVYHFRDDRFGSGSSIADMVYPVGSIYMSINSTDPGDLFGGTWERITGQFLLAATDGGSSGAAQVAGNTGGEAEHKLVNDELPTTSGHMDVMRAGNNTSNTTVVRYTGGKMSVVRNNAGSTAITTAAQTPTVDSYKPDRVIMSFGADKAHNNMPPYLAVYIWKRTA